MSNILHQINKVPDTGEAKSVNVSANNMTIDHVYVGSGRTNSHLLGIMSVVKEHVVDDSMPILTYTMVFKQMLNGKCVAHKTFASNAAGRIGKLQSEGFANIGVMKSRRIKK